MPSTAFDAPGVAALPLVDRPQPTTAGAGDAPASARRRAPLPVLAAALIAGVESLVLLTFGLTGLDRVFGTVLRPSGALLALSLLLLAAWVVGCAGGGANIADGAGRRLLAAVAYGEIALLLVVVVASVLDADGVWLLVVGPLGALPVPALGVLALAVPTAKLLLAGAPAARAWIVTGPRQRVRRPPAAPGRPLLCGLTVGAIGVTLTGLALLGPAADPAGAPGHAPAPAPTTVGATP